MNHPRYPEYKPSGVEWLGEVPRYWEVRRLKYCATCNDDVLPESTPLDYRIRYVDISSVSLEQGIEKIEEYDFDDAPSRARRRVRDGDTILSTVRTYLKAVARIEKPDETLIVSTGFAVIRPGEALDSRFLSYLLRSDGFVGEIVANSVGVSYPAINASQVMGFVSLTPPIEEQRAIAAFLDRETARIDALIEKKQRFIELLQEKRAALISRAVTRGLDSNCPLKDSGVEWLGQVPAHWKVKPFRRCCAITEGQIDPKDDDFLETVLIASNHIESDTGRILLTESAQEQGAISGKYPVRKGEVIYSKIRPALNKVCIAQGDWLCSADMYPIQCNKQLETTFLFYFLLSKPFVQLMVDESMRVAMPKVNRDTLMACPIIVPPDHEQRMITKYLDRETVKLDMLNAKVESAIDKLKEYRAALIAAAVTGRIDVREA